MEEELSECIGHEPCPNCGSRDNLGRYTDGHGYCFGCAYYEHPKGDTNLGNITSTNNTNNNSGLLVGDLRELKKRKISEDTCRKFGYHIGEFNGQAVHIAPFKNKEGTVAQHIRFPNKDFVWTGAKKNVTQLFGQHLFKDGGKMVTVCEGEIDAMSVSQMWDNKWPVVSISSGAQGAKKDFAKSLEWLEKFETVVICFDMDEPGQKSAQTCSLMLTPGKAKIAHLPLKDANEMLVNGRSKECIDAIWNAKTYRPDGIVTLADVKDRALLPIETGLSWWSDKLTDLTYGRRHGEVYAFGAGTGVGKTDFFTQQVQHDITVLDEKVAIFFLEQSPAETAKRICGKSAGKRFHIPDAGWTTEELAEEFDRMEATKKLYMYDHFGCADWDIIQSRMRFLNKSEGVRMFYLDHLTALATEREELETIMAEIGSLVKELDIIIHLISHLATPDGKPHEEGGRVMVRHFKGSRAIGFWCHFMFGLERDQQEEDLVKRQQTTFRVLKDRFSGQATGQTYLLGYDAVTGRLFETELIEDCPFDKGDDDY